MTKQLFLIAAFILSSICIKAQTNHSTIESIGVSYKSVPNASASVNLVDIKCIPQATITLKQNSGASKIYFKIVNPETNEVVYQINYSLNAAAITNQEGIKIFENNNGVVHISSGQILTLRPYLYKLQTENSQSQLSTELVETH